MTQTGLAAQFGMHSIQIMAPNTRAQIYWFLNRPKDSSNHSGNRPHSLRFQGEVFEADKVDVPTEGILEVSTGREKW
jgi:hypothetical protein